MSHNLSMAEMANMLFMNSAAAVNQFETGNSKPSMNTLMHISTFFGVSLEWLVGLAKEPYTESSIAIGNKALVKRRELLQADSLINHFVGVYQDKNKDRYDPFPPPPSLNLQGNIIFLENATFLHDLEHDKNKSYVESLIMEFTPKSQREQIKIRKNERYIQFLEYRLHGCEVPYFQIAPEKILPNELFNE